jgi:hypothetical protein
MHLPESREHAFGELGIARMNAFAHLHQERVTTSERASAEAMLQGVLFAVAQFAQQSFFHVYDTRLQKLEVEAQATRTQLEDVRRHLQLAEHVVRRVTAKEISPFLELIRGACTDSFGVTPDLVVAERGDPERPIELVVDVSKGPPAAIDRARIGGARSQFYDLLLSRLPTDVCDSIEFQFVFPRK